MPASAVTSVKRGRGASSGTRCDSLLVTPSTFSPGRYAVGALSLRDRHPIRRPAAAVAARIPAVSQSCLDRLLLPGAFLTEA